MHAGKKVAVVLCGSGRGDGSEIHESVSCLMHLSRLGASYQCFAPDKPQMHVVNHLSGEVTGETRNCLVEAARIARGDCKPLHTLDASGFDAVVFPGGFGAAKNLCTFAIDGVKMSIDPQANRVLLDFHVAGKPIGLCCIAPVMAAKVLKAKVTLGDDNDAARAIASFGATHVACPVDRAVVDAERRVVTAPAYMYGEATPHQIHLGIGEMIEQMLAMAK
jgi:enhancing lycopene biosynthesis protein 2